MKPIVLYMRKLDDRLKWMPHQKTLYDAFVSRIEEEQLVEVKISKKTKEKTLPQLGYWYGFFLPAAVIAFKELGFDTLYEVKVPYFEDTPLDICVGGYPVTIQTSEDTVDLLFKTLFKMHKNLKKLPQKRKMTSEEMSELIDFSLGWAAENLGVFIETPKGKQ